jgi:RHS repeat-associated protein
MKKCGAFCEPGIKLIGKLHSKLITSPQHRFPHPDNFDDTGGRPGAKFGGDQNGWNLRQASYSVNALNQYLSRDVPGYENVIGLGFATNTITVNGLSTYRKGEFFRAEVPIGNGAGPVWTNITVAETGVPSVSGNLRFPKAAETFTYDLDGNLTSDGLWTNIWDAENRLLSMQSLSTVPDAGKLRVDFTYDWKGRRIQKVVSIWNETAYVPQSTAKYVYDGWNLVAILNSDSSLQSSFAWGTDLSGSPQGAGGVGGLLWMTVASGANAGTYFFAFDGNGNVVALVNAANGAIASQYEYGPFGELLRATGPMARANPFRFSTKYQDDETDLSYYGSRYLSAATGRWISRDAMTERACRNIYAFLKNQPIASADYLGFVNWYEYPNVQVALARASSGWHYDPDRTVNTYIVSPWPYKMPDGTPSGGGTSNLVERAVRWEEDCPCGGHRLAGYSLKSVTAILFPSKDAVSAGLTHERQHATYMQQYDQYDLSAFAPAYGKCLSGKCYEAWVNYMKAVTWFGQLQVSVRNLQLEVDNYPPYNANRDYFRMLLKEQRAKVVPSGIEMLSATVRLATDCGGQL